MPKSPRVAAIRQRYYAHLPHPHQIYYDLLADRLRAYPGATVLNIGCGTGHEDRFDWLAHKGSAHVIGLDVDPGAAVNPYIDSFVLARETEEWAVPAQTITFATCRSVLEHIQSPDHFFENLRRVLKPGGEFVFITPNILHPLMLASALLPAGFKMRLLTKATKRIEDDIFPTVYRINTRRRIQHQARLSGFVVDKLQVGEWSPSTYLDFSLLTFRFAELYYHVVTRTGLEKYFGINIIGLLHRP